MVFVSMRAPFANITEDDEWLMWQAQTPLYSLICDKETDGRYEITGNIGDKKERVDELNLPTTILSPQRNQYNAVLNKFELASKRAGSFSAWNT